MSLIGKKIRHIPRRKAWTVADDRLETTENKQLREYSRKVTWVVSITSSPPGRNGIMCTPSATGGKPEKNAISITFPQGVRGKLLFRVEEGSRMGVVSEEGTRALRCLMTFENQLRVAQLGLHEETWIVRGAAQIYRSKGERRGKKTWSHRQT